MKWFNKSSISKLEEKYDLLQSQIVNLTQRVAALEESRVSHLEIMKNQSKQLLILGEIVLKSVTPPKLNKD